MPPTLVVVQAPSPVGAPGWALIDTLKVRAQDEGGIPRPGIPLTWTVREGGGSIAPIADTTDAEGLAAAVWTLGPQAGANGVRASATEDAFVDFQATGAAFRVDRLASSEAMGCGIVDGGIFCWGDEFWENTAPVSDRQLFGWTNSSPGLVDDSREFIDLAVGSTSVCGLDDQHAVWCANANFPQVMHLDGLPPIRGIVSAGLTSAYCAMAESDSTAWCWQMGGVPAQVPGSPAFTVLSLEGGGYFSEGITVCGLRADSAAACWGKGPLGDGTENPSDTPVSVAGGHRFVQLAVGEGFACGRTADGSVWCWGNDWANEQELPTPILTPALAVTGASRIASGWNYAQLLSVISGIGRWQGAGFEGPEPLFGLEDLPIDRFANDDVFCVQLADDQVYCHDEMFNSSTGVYYYYYSPIQPIRPAPEASSRH
ncbi:MAG TPA: hypothetical protein VFO06_08515 [Gemmatimonadales bacterium]|nr:hypothetical protein [Gemmatimonadales bacterium]